MTYNDAVELIALADEYEMKASGDHDNNVDASKIEMVHRAAIAKVLSLLKCSLFLNCFQ